jgi:hypothetical protein
MLGAYLVGTVYLDRASISRRTRAIWGLFIICALNTLQWAWAFYIQFIWEDGGYDKDRPIEVCCVTKAGGLRFILSVKMTSAVFFFFFHLCFVSADYLCDFVEAAHCCGLDPPYRRLGLVLRRCFPKLRSASTSRTVAATLSLLLCISSWVCVNKPCARSALILRWRGARIRTQDLMIGTCFSL